MSKTSAVTHCARYRTGYPPHELAALAALLGLDHTAPADMWTGRGQTASERWMQRRPSRALTVVALASMLSCGTGTSRGYASLQGVRVSQDGRGLVLVLVGIHGACDKVLPPDVEEKPQEVKVTVPLQVDKRTCVAIGLSFSAQAQLAMPLGGRRIVDGQTGRVLPRQT